MKSIVFPGTIQFSIIAILLVAFAGCDQPNVSQVESVPKQDFHKPEDVQTGISRIREVHDLLVSDAPLPAPTSFTFVEIVHSHGPGDSHVHYRQVDESGHYDDVNHDHNEHDSDHNSSDPSKAEPTKHYSEVDIFTELKDIVRWLPAIAADGDLPESSWLQIKKVSEGMSQRLATVFEPGEMEAKRSAYQADSTEFELGISTLEAIEATAQEEDSSND